jgi:hypothetical protein
MKREAILYPHCKELNNLSYTNNSLAGAVIMNNERDGGENHSIISFA